MLKEYLVVAQEALEAKKEMFLIKQQRLELLQQEMLLFSQISEDSSSLHSGEEQEYISYFTAGGAKLFSLRATYRKTYKGLGSEVYCLIG